jgi:hypothetical protein
MEEFYCYKTLDEIFNKDEVLSCIATGPESEPVFVFDKKRVVDSCEPFNFTLSHYASKKLAILFKKAEPRIRQPNTPIICPKCQSNIMKTL